MHARLYPSARDVTSSGALELPTLLVQTAYFDPDAPELAEALGFALYELLTRPRYDKLAFGSGIPIRIATHAEEVNLSAAKHVVVVSVLGQRVLENQHARKACIETLRYWNENLADRGMVVPVFTCRGWADLKAQLPGRPIEARIAEDQSRDVLHVTLEIVLSVCRLLCEPGKAVQLFVSHAKADLPSTEDAARKLREFVREMTTGAAFHDTTAFDRDADVQRELNAAAQQGVFLALRSDAYGTRHGCQRQLLWAKQARLPTLTVEVLDQGETRSYPYSGNGPTVVWSRGAEEGDVNALRVVLRALVEWLRARHFLGEAERLTAGLPDRLALTRPPELLDLAQGPLVASPPVVLHPDPELSFAEREVLRRAQPRLQLVTPTTLYRAMDTSRTEGPLRPAGLQGMRVALAVSDVIDDAHRRKGIRREHAQDVLVHVARSMVSAGAALAYAGDLRRGGYDELFADLILSYSASGVRAAELLYSYRPATFDGSTSSGRPAFNAVSVADSNQRRLPPPCAQPSRARSALYLSEMRRFMTLDCSARVLLAGQALPKKNASAVGYGGAYPGVAEEAWHSLHPADDRPRPLYVLGGFGGAAAVVASLAAPDRRTELLESATFSGDEYSEYRAVAAEFDADPERAAVGVPGTPQALADDIRETFAALLETDARSVAWNGLTVAENQELLWTEDIVRATALILEGLFAVRARQLEHTLEIELVSGDLLRAEKANAIVLPVFEDVPIAGAGVALDKALDGAVSAARDRGHPMIALTSRQVDANWLVFANLGPLGDKVALPAIIEREARRISQLALRHDFGRISLVTFAATVLGDVEEIARRMLAGFASLPDKTQLQWFEANAARFARLQAYLGKREDVALTHKVVPELEAAAQASGEDLFAVVRRSNGELTCTLLVPSVAPVCEVRTSALSDQELAALNRATLDTPSFDEIANMGRSVSRLLFGEAGAIQLAAAAPECRLVIQHDLDSAAIPFETLQLGTLVPALQKGIVRRLSLPAEQLSSAYQRPPTAGKLRIALIVNPTRDLPHAEKEAEMVCRQLADAEQAEIMQLCGQAATKQAVLEVLTDTGADVLHYCGHAAFERIGEDGSGLVCADGALTARDLGGRQIGPRIVFFNACQSARVRSGETTTHAVARAFAEAVLRRGVEAYLGTFWPVADDAAATFAARVYLSLARGDELHRAVTAARNVLFAARSPDWANYLLFGSGAFRLKTG